MTIWGSQRSTGFLLSGCEVPQTGNEKFRSGCSKSWVFFLGITMSLCFHKLLPALHFINHTVTHFDRSSDLKLGILFVLVSIFLELMNNCSYNKSSDCELGGLWYWYLLPHIPLGCPKENEHALICAIGWVSNLQREFEKGRSFLIISD